MKVDEIPYLIDFIKKTTDLIEKWNDELLVRIKNLSTKDETIVLSYKINNVYCAYEEIFKEIIKVFEVHIKNLTGYYKVLLRRMNNSVYKVRPVVINNDSFIMLDELRKFRHFFRHSYGQELKKEKVKKLTNDYLSLYDKIMGDIKSFLGFLHNIVERELG